jgi:hypothetical protein
MRRVSRGRSAGGERQFATLRFGFKWGKLERVCGLACTIAMPVRYRLSPAEEARPITFGSPKKRNHAISDSITSRAPYPQEALLIEAVAEMRATRVLASSPGLAQFSGAVAAALPSAKVVCSYLDLYRAALAIEHWRQRLSNLRIECAADLLTGDLPAGEVDVAALPFSASGEAELTRELIQQAHERLRVGGRLYASTDRPADTWLGEKLRNAFAKVERRTGSTGGL